MPYGNSLIFLLHYWDHFITDKGVISSSPSLHLKRHSAWLEMQVGFVVVVVVIFTTMVLQMSLTEVTKTFIQVTFSFKCLIMD